MEAGAGVPSAGAPRPMNRAAADSALAMTGEAALSWLPAPLGASFCIPPQQNTARLTLKIPRCGAVTPKRPQAAGTNPGRQKLVAGLGFGRYTAPRAVVSSEKAMFM